MLLLIFKGKTMKKYLLVIAVLLSAGMSAAYAKPYPSSLEGTYDCNSVEVDTGENYKGVSIVKKTGQTYAVKSTFTDGSSYIGTGIYDQQKHNFSLAFINPKNAEETGVAVAEVKKNNAMTSTWTYLNKTNVGHATCTMRDKPEKTKINL
jgi:hypothetical protein